MKRIPILATVLALTACGGGHDVTAPSAPPDPNTTAAGVYILVQVNDIPLNKGRALDAQGDTIFTYDTLTLRTDRSYRDAATLQVHFLSGAWSPPSTGYENGSFSVVGSQITFTSQPSDGSQPFSYSGGIGPTSLSYTIDAVSYTYARQ